MKSTLKQQILQLKSKGFNNVQISKYLNCNISTVNYHVSPNGKNNRKKANAKFIKKHNYRPNVIYIKIKTFINKQIKEQKLSEISTKKAIYFKLSNFIRKNNCMSNKITVEDIINKFGPNPTCYLTGEQIDLKQPSTYQFDHIIPASRGGDNSLDNLGICTKNANKAKNDMTQEEFIQLCHKVLVKQGYKIEPKQN